jgi:hypothetical protein
MRPNARMNYADLFSEKETYFEPGDEFETLDRSPRPGKPMLRCQLLFLYLP